MFSFSACFQGGNVFINEKIKYAANEILTAYLSIDDTEIDFESILDELKHLKKALIYHEDEPYDFRKNYNRNVYDAMELMERINRILETIPPYNRILHFPLKTLSDLLDEHKFLFKDGFEYDEEDTIITEDTLNEYGFGYKDEVGNYVMYINYFELEYDDLPDDIDILHSIRETNSDISSFFDGYISFIRSCLLVQTVFKPFVRDYLNSKRSYLTDTELAEQFSRFEKEHNNAFSKIKCRMNSFGYKVIKDDTGKDILCEKIRFESIDSFLFYDLFFGIKSKSIPGCCRNCGRFFLLSGGKYISYCNSPVKGASGKTCRELGAKRLYDDKCRNDPIWQAYNRAYKAHYARYMKKKMTTSEFEKWSRFAAELRDKAESGEIGLDEYMREVKK